MDPGSRLLTSAHVLLTFSTCDGLSRVEPLAAEGPLASPVDRDIPGNSFQIIVGHKPCTYVYVYMYVL